MLLKGISINGRDLDGHWVHPLVCGEVLIVRLVPRVRIDNLLARNQEVHLLLHRLAHDACFAADRPAARQTSLLPVELHIRNLYLLHVFFVFNHGGCGSVFRVILFR